MMSFTSHNDDILSLTYTAAVASASVELDRRVKGVAIATCCHHACVWGDYTGAHWLLAQGTTLSDLLFFTDCCVWLFVCLFVTMYVCLFYFILHSLQSDRYFVFSSLFPFSILFLLLFSSFYPF